MHPILENSRRLLLYVLGWIPLAGMTCYLLAAPGGLGWRDAAAIAVPLCMLYAFMCLSAWYVCRGTPLEQSGFLRIVITLSLAAVLNSALWVLAARALGSLLASSPRFAGMDVRLGPDVPMFFGAGILLYFLAVALHYVLLAASESQEAKQREMKMSVLAREAELRALKAQVNPHFLFNSLNSISALTASDPARAREMCVLLGDFLRRTLGLGEKAAIPLEEELSLVRAFLAVEKVRFGTRIQMQENIDAKTLDVPVPPLLLQPLVENAIVHGIANLVDGGWIRLEIQRRDATLVIAVENSFDPEAPPRRRNGVGLANVRQRLAARYGNTATFEVKSEEDRFQVGITLPAREERPTA